MRKIIADLQKDDPTAGNWVPSHRTGKPCRLGEPEIQCHLRPLMLPCLSYRTLESGSLSVVHPVHHELDPKVSLPLLFLVTQGGL